MQRLLHPTYFPNIAHVVAAVNADKIYFEICDNYQKQTFRNRFEIYAANGKLALTVPVIYTQKNRQLYKDVKIVKTTTRTKEVEIICFWAFLSEILSAVYLITPF